MYIRPAELKDLAAIIALLNCEITGGINIFRLEPLNETMANRWWQLHGQGRYHAIVAEPTEADRVDGTTVAGWASLAPHSAYEGYNRTAELSVWVNASFRRRGCAAMLVKTLQDSCVDRNIRTVISRIESNNVPSLRLHEACGFKPAGLLEDVGEKFGQSLSVVLMQYRVPQLHA